MRNLEWIRCEAFVSKIERLRARNIQHAFEALIANEYECRYGRSGNAQKAGTKDKLVDNPMDAASNVHALVNKLSGLVQVYLRLFDF